MTRKIAHNSISNVKKQGGWHEFIAALSAVTKDGKKPKPPISRRLVTFIYQTLRAARE